MDISKKVELKDDEYLCTQLPNGNRMYLLCECCGRYIPRRDMLQEEYAKKLNNCVICYKQQREQQK